MFPICGRLYGGKYVYRKKEYELGCHGFARHSVFELAVASSSFLTLQLKANEETKKVYPFDFVLSITFSLNEKNLSVKYEVKNSDSKDLIFALGGHPAFNVPLDKGAFEDYYVEFGKKCDAYRVDFSDTCFVTKNDKPVTSGATKRLCLTHDLFDNDAIFMYNTDKKIRLASEKTQKSVTLSFDKFKYVGLWHKPKSDAPYVCIEPWMSIPSIDGKTDNLETKEDMVHLPAGYTFRTSFGITIE
jgi:galactose mutarotase-like enzyme